MSVWVLLVPLEAQSQDIDLADVVGGGNGFGTGALGDGIDPRSGTVGPSPAGDAGREGLGTYFSTSLPFVDGVFVPNGSTQLTSNPVHVFAFDTSNDYWDWVENGPNDPDTVGTSEDFSSLEGVDYSTGGNRMIGLHSNLGVTFDLGAIRAANPGVSITALSAVTGRAPETPPPGTGGGDADLRVFLDGVLQLEILDMPQNVAIPVDIPIPGGARFLTVVATDGTSDNYSADRVILGNPRLTTAPAQVPALAPEMQGATAALLAVVGWFLGRSLAAGRPTRRCS